MTTYPELTTEYQKIVNQGDKFILSLVSTDIFVFFGDNPTGPGHSLTKRLTNGLRFDDGVPFDVYAKTYINSDPPITIALTIWT
jgi:hypothetical protein